MTVELGEATSDTRGDVRDWRKVVRTSARRVGFVVIVGLAMIGGWSIYARLTDPIRLARLALDNGSAQDTLARRLARQRVCARVLDGPEPFTAYTAGPTTLPSVRALLAAGLIEPVPAADAPPERPYTFYRMTRAAAPFVSADQVGSHRYVSLCYGRPKLGWAFLETDGSTDPSPVMKFTYTIGERPAWADRPDMRAAFPFLNDLTKDPIRHFLGVRFGGGTKPDVEDLWIEPAMDVDSAVSGFSFCPPRGYPRVEACKGGRDD